ncbi:hypothetical protein PT974_06162 [Cladobotryum mycophilum]|uniref:F-box domain-containing protein n=1 Tax=Cladobotryum mycophilum TaxID=491253 RepID=A0ABR0SLP8_9HYPO
MPRLKFNILDLPVDVLALILRPLLTAPDGGVISLCACTACPVNPLPILLIHPSIYAIACPLFYGVANGFLLDLTGKHGGHVRQCLREAAEEEEEEERGKGRGRPWLRPTGGRLLLLSPEARRRVQRLEVRMDRLRGWVYEELGPLMEDMAVQGGLADFCLTVCYGGDGSSNKNKRRGAVATSSRPNAPGGRRGRGQRIVFPAADGGPVGAPGGPGSEDGAA